MSARLCVWPRAYVGAVDAALGCCFDEDALIDDYRDVIQSDDATVTKVKKPTVQITVQSGKLVLTLKKASVSIHHHRDDKDKYENYEKSISGSFEVSIDLLHPPPSSSSSSRRRAATYSLYSANVDFVDLLFCLSGNAGNSNCVITINGKTITGGTFTGGTICINSRSSSSSSLSSSSSSAAASASSSSHSSSSTTTTYESTQKSSGGGGGKRSGSPLNAGPSPKRTRRATPVTYSGTDQSIRSTTNDASIVVSGIDQSLRSSGKDAVIVSSGIDSSIVSSGDGASIKCSGTDGHVNSTGADAIIKASGCDVTIDSSGPSASINASGTGVTITSSGTNALINCSGMDTTIKSTGLNACISNSGTNTRVQSSGSAINDDLGKTIIRRLSSAIVENLNFRLPETDRGHVMQWTVRNGYVESSTDPTMIDEQDPQDYGRMATLLISTDSIVNAFESYFSEDKTSSWNLTQADLINVSGKKKQRSLSDSFPDFSIKYPRASMEVSLRAIEVPTVTFSDENLTVTLPGTAVLRAHLRNGSVVDFLTTEVTLEIDVLLELNPGQLKGIVTSVSSKSITVVKTTLGSVNRKVLKDVFNLIASDYLSRKFDEICQRGIPLPSPPLAGFMDYENVEMATTDDDFLRIDADIKFCA